jgi:hypothetical protein
MKNSKKLIKESESVSFVIDAWKNITSDSVVNVIACTPTPILYSSIETGANRKTATYYFSLIKPIILEIGSNKVTAVITDNENTMNATRDLIKNSFPQIIIHGCSAHILSLLAKDLAKYSPTLKSVVYRVNSIVSEIHVSTPKSAKFKELMEEYSSLTNTTPTALKTYSSTRYVIN